MIRLSLLQILLLFLRNALAQTGRLEVQATTLRHALVEKRGLFSAEAFENFVQEALRFPGIKAVNLSVFFGRLLYGWRGIVVAVCGTVLPSVLGGILAFCFYNGLLTVFCGRNFGWACGLVHSVCSSCHFSNWARMPRSLGRCCGGRWEWQRWLCFCVSPPSSSWQ